MKLVLARHGESAGNLEQVFRGPGSQSDGLTDVGEAQARALGAHLATLALPAPRVYASTYRRAQATAQAIADALGTDVTVLDGVQEVDCGEWVGRAYTDMHTHRGEVLGADGAPDFPAGNRRRGWRPASARRWSHCLAATTRPLSCRTASLSRRC